MDPMFYIFHGTLLCSLLLYGSYKLGYHIAQKRKCYWNRLLHTTYGLYLDGHHHEMDLQIMLIGFGFDVSCRRVKEALEELAFKGFIKSNNPYSLS